MCPRQLRVKNDEYYMDAFLSGESMRVELRAAAHHRECVRISPAVVASIRCVTTGFLPLMQKVFGA